MRKLIYGMVGLGLLGTLAACGSSDGDTGTTVASTTATTTSTTTSTATTSSTGGASTTTTTTTTTSTGGGGAGTGGMSNCTELSPTAFIRTAFNADPMAGDSVIAFNPGMIGAAAPDQAAVQFYDPTVTGVQDLTDSTNNNFATCATCVLVFEDVDTTAGTVGKYFFQSTGQVDLGSTTLPGATGAMTDVTLVEVTIDSSTFTSTPVPGGDCLHIASANFAFTPTPAAWTCDPQLFGDKGACDCQACGVADEDCGTSTLPINGCADGQTCAADGMSCAGTPTAWTCAPSMYGDGQCDCGCGIIDSDCDGTAVVHGCTDATDTCSATGTCVPAGWTCDPTYYGDMQGCDCGCGVVDIDCSDSTQNVIGCAAGQTCGAAGDCEGLPTSWTCDPAAYGDGATCNCGCGTSPDPDCSNTALPITGCTGTDTCNANFACVPTTWTCNVDYDGDGFCDCGCGAVDSDCADATSASCEYCNDTGSCDESGSDCSTINATNSGVCMP